MISRPEPLEKLLTILRSLPSVGPKMSERIAFNLLHRSEDQIQEMLETIHNTYQKVRPCPICGYWDDTQPCRICSDTTRDSSLLCVIESSQDLIAMSRIRGYHGLFHVLGGALSPLEGVGPQDLRIEPLFKRLESGGIREVILGLNADIEGETTAQYLTRQIQTFSERHLNGGIKISRLAQGLPAGAELEYMDEMTLMRALEDRKSLFS